MPRGKPAGVRCVQLTPDNRCALFGRPERPAVCASLRPAPEMCGGSAAEALVNLTLLEDRTMPGSPGVFEHDASEHNALERAGA